MRSPSTRGFTDVKGGAKYGGVEKRTFKQWMKNGLRYTRLPTGRVRVSYDAIDEYLARYEAKDEATELAREIVEGL